MNDKAMHFRIGRGRRGIAMVSTILSLPALWGICSLGAEYARVQLAKVELERAADAAARAAANELPISGATAARNAAIAYAGYHTADGSAVTLTSADVEIGAYVNGVFTVDATPSSAVRVTASRTAAKGNAIPLGFGRIVGVSSCDVKGVSTVTGVQRPPGGLVGLTGINIKNNSFIGSYNSAIYTNPSSGSANSSAAVLSNGSITVGTNGTIKGDVLLGPSGSVDAKLAVSGSSTHQSSAITPPVMPALAPGTNPNGVPQAYVAHSPTELPGGTYWFTSLIINGALSFSGKATVYVNGNVDISATLTAYNSVPGNLVIYQLGSSRTFGNSADNNVDLTADVSAP